MSSNCYLNVTFCDSAIHITDNQFVGWVEEKNREVEQDIQLRTHISGKVKYYHSYFKCKNTISIFIYQGQFGNICVVKVRFKEFPDDFSLLLWKYRFGEMPQSQWYIWIFGWLIHTLHYSPLALGLAPASLHGWADCQIRRRNFQSWAFQSHRLSFALVQARCSQIHQPGGVDGDNHAIDMGMDIRMDRGQRT